IGLTPRQAIGLTGRLRGGARHEVALRTAAILKRLDLEPWANKRMTAASGGVVRLVMFAMASVWPGRLVILDEPTNDVDPARRRLLWQAIRALADAGSGVLLVTHNVAEAERAVDRLVIIDQGRLVAVGTPAELDHAHADLRIDVTL